MRSSQPRAAEPLSSQEIAVKLRKTILDGKVRPGQRLPPWRVLEQQFGTTKLTMQRAIHRLVKDGYLRTRDRRGTFVADHPPHRSSYALAFPWGSEAPRSQFFEAIAQEAAKFRSPARRISIFHEIGEHVDTDDYHRLMRFVEAQALAGVILVNPILDGPVDLQLRQERSLPRVAIMKGDSGLEGMPTVYPDTNLFLVRALNRAAAEGRRRVGIVTLGSVRPPDLDFPHYEKLCAERGLQLRKHWLQGGFPVGPEWIRPSVAAVFATAASDRPDTLIITDDNLVYPATRALKESGLDSSDDVLTIAHTNYPWPLEAAVPVTRLGYDISELIRICLERLDQQSHGEQLPGHTAVPPLFEEEYVASKPLAVAVGGAA